MPLCNGTDTGCVSPMDNITGRESELTSFWCFTRENGANRHKRHSMTTAQTVGAVSYAGNVSGYSHASLSLA